MKYCGEIVLPPQSWNMLILEFQSGVTVAVEN